MRVRQRGSLQTSSHVHQGAASCRRTVSGHQSDFPSCEKMKMKMNERWMKHHCSTKKGNKKMTRKTRMRACTMRKDTTKKTKKTEGILNKSSFLEEEEVQRLRQPWWWWLGNQSTHKLHKDRQRRRERPHKSTGMMNQQLQMQRRTKGGAHCCQT